MSIGDHRAWVAKYGGWTPPKPRPGEKLVEHVMGQLATALERSEVELVNDVIARVGFNEPERARVEEWARQALTIVVLTAERAAFSGTTFSNNILFHELAKAFSPTYTAALERGPGRIPDEMLPSTLVATRDDVKYAGLRVQQIFGFARRGVAGWYTTKRVQGAWRVRRDGTLGHKARRVPLSGEALARARAQSASPRSSAFTRASCGPTRCRR
jgi:hypothetical protein